MSYSLDLLYLFLGWFVCLSYSAEYHDPHCGGKQVIAHLFEWKWSDIANECERYLGPKGFCGVQISPPNENAILTAADRPWYERYQPVSYKLVTRSGNEAQFADMVTRCKNAGVRIYADAVINHMAALGNKGVGTAGSTFDSDAKDFPGVPFSAPNFHSRSDCPSNDGTANNLNDPVNMRDCYLVNLVDLDGSQAYVQDKISGYFNHLISLGVAGFRVDAAKHMWPADIAAIQAKTNDLPEGGRPFFVHEVVDYDDGAITGNEYFNLGYVTEFRYVRKVKDGASNLGLLDGVYDPNWNMAPSEHAFVFVDNHDTQRSHESLYYKDGGPYKRAVAFTLANDYGFTRVMSSYEFTDFAPGPPHNGDYTPKDVIIKTDGSCDNGWVCEHRWKSIGNMVKFRNTVTGTSRENFKYQNGILSFNRGNKGFFAMGNNDFNANIFTGLPAGEYCDLISECAMKVKVDGNGFAQVSPQNPAEPFVAIITGDDVTAGPGVTLDPSATTQAPAITTQAPAITTQAPQVTGQDYKRTIIMLDRQFANDDVFIRGGIDFNHRPGCANNVPSSPCNIPIRHFVRQSPINYYDKVNAWGQGDNYLDWDGAEPGQGLYQGQPAGGTPTYWSTNDQSDVGYSPLNQWGPNYWIADIEMDCSRTENGFFEVKGFVNGGWEGDISAISQCSGPGAATPPYTSLNHFGRCGYLNVFHYSQGSCEILPVP